MTRGPDYQLYIGYARSSGLSHMSEDRLHNTVYGGSFMHLLAPCPFRDLSLRYGKLPLLQFSRRHVRKCIELLGHGL